MSFTYTQGIPATDDNPSDDQPDMQVNNDSNYSIWNVDHVGFNLTPGGYHTVIHEVTQTQTPAVISGVNQVFSGIPGTMINTATSNPVPNIPSNGDTQLYTLTGMGGLAQMSGHNNTANGYVWCAGILLQWGTINALGTVTFPVAFPNNCLNVQFTPVVSGGTTGSTTFAITVGSPTLSTTGFKVQIAGGSGTGYGPYYWFAVGF
jgi:hypothetical protein